MYFVQLPIENSEAALLAKHLELVVALSFRGQPALEQKGHLSSGLRTDVQGI